MLMTFKYWSCFSPEHPYIRFEYGDDDVVVEAHVAHDEAQGAAEL